MQVSKPPHQESAKIPMSRMIELRRSSEGGDETWTLSESTDSDRWMPSAWVEFATKICQTYMRKPRQIFRREIPSWTLPDSQRNRASAYTVKSSNSLSTYVHIVKCKCTCRI